MARKRILSVDGGGIRGIIPLCALVELEKRTGQPSRDFFSFMAGTSTGAIISGGLGMGLSAARCLEFYTTLNEEVFHSNPWDWIFSLGSFRYRTEPLVKLIKKFVGNPIMNEVPIDIMITAMRVRDGQPFRFVKDNDVNKKEFGKLRLADCIAASSAAPTFFEPWKVPGIGACVDGGVGVAGNPAYLACVEAFEKMPDGKYPLAQTTIVSLGTGFFKSEKNPGNLLEWVQWVVGELLDEPPEQQIALIRRHYKPQGVHFVRWNVEMPQDIGLDDIGAVPRLVEIGKAAAEQTDWDKLLTAPDGTKALDLEQLEKRIVVKVPGRSQKKTTKAKPVRGKASSVVTR
jgi:hypothetical protein